MPRDEVTSGDSTLTMKQLMAAADELAYLKAPVEARLSKHGLRFLRWWLAPDPAHVPPPAPLSPLGLIGGIRLIVDEALPSNRIEFRDSDGTVTASFDLPIP